MNRSIALLALFPAVATAVPLQLTHQGRLLDSAGTALEGPHDLTVELYDASAGGTPVWSESLESVNFEAGYFRVILGEGTPLNSEALEGDELHVSLAIDGGAPLPARQRVTSVPYAIAAGHAETAETATSADTATTAQSADTATSLSGGTVDATSIAINGTAIFDSSGAFLGDSLSNLSCTADQTAVFDGAGWGCADVVSPTWAELPDIPSDFADGEDADTLGGIEGCAPGQVVAWDGTAFGCTDDTDTTLSDTDVLDIVAAADVEAQSVTADSADISGTVDAGRLRGATLTFRQCNNTRYACEPTDCRDLCIANGERMASVQEVYLWSSTGKDSCAYKWMLDETDFSRVVRAFPMYNNRTTGGCGRTNTGPLPRIEGYSTAGWTSTTKADCACSGTY